MCVSSADVGMLSWVIMAGGLQGNTHKLAVEVVNKKGRTVAIGDKFQGQVKVNNVLPWWPYSMNETSPAYMYTLKVCDELMKVISSELYFKKFQIHLFEKNHKDRFFIEL